MATSKQKNIWQIIKLLWEDRPPREQNILIYGGIISLIIILYMTFEAGVTSYQTLTRDLPKLRSESSLSSFYRQKITSNVKVKSTENLQQKVTRSLANYSKNTQLENKTITIDKNTLPNKIEPQYFPIFSEPLNINIGDKKAMEVEVKFAPAETVFTWIDNLQNIYNLDILELNLDVDAFNKLSGTVKISE